VDEWDGPLPAFFDGVNTFARKVMYDLKDELPREAFCLKILERRSRDAIDIALLIAPTVSKDEYQRIGMAYIARKDRKVFDEARKHRVTIV
jgi:hypothetical protein